LKGAAVTTSKERKSIASLDNGRLVLSLAALSFAVWSMIANVVSWAYGSALGVRGLVSSMGLALLCVALVVQAKYPRLHLVLLALSLMCLALVTFGLRA
jgi:hypothetical protein